MSTTRSDSSGYATVTASENQDFCDECHEGGELLCCDHCDRSYHGVCLDLESNQLPVVWWCPRCVSSRDGLDCRLEGQQCRLSTRADSPSRMETTNEPPQPPTVDGVPKEQNNIEPGMYVQHDHANTSTRSPSSDNPCETDYGTQQVRKESDMSSADVLLAENTAMGVAHGHATGLGDEDQREAYLASDRSLKTAPRQKAMEHSPSHALPDCDETLQREDFSNGPDQEAAHLRSGVPSSRVESLHARQVLLDVRDHPSSRDTICLPGTPTPSPVGYPIRPEAHESSTVVDEMIEGLLANGQFEHCSSLDLTRADLCALDEVSKTIDSIWKQSTVRTPVAVAADSCFASTEPTEEDLWRASFSTKGSKVFVNGEENGRSENFALAFRQLYRPNKRCPISVIGIQPSKTALTSHYQVPTSLAAYVTAHAQRDVIYNLTPRYSFVDLHIDYGADGISKTMSDCEKYWFLFPPTTRNLDLLASVHGEQGKLGKILNRLEYGIIAKTRSSEALYIPAGCIHATYTTTGGFLVAKDFVTIHTYKYIASLMQSRYFKVFDFESRELCLEWFMISLEVATRYQPILAVCKVWIVAENVLKSLTPRLLLRVLREVKGCFEEALEGAGDNITQCPCGWEKKSSRCTFKSHWDETHLILRHP